MRNLVAFFDDRFCNYRLPPDHPDKPERLTSIATALRSSDLEALVQACPRPATEEELARVHELGYLNILIENDKIARSSGQPVQIDPDTWISEGMLEAAKLAAGAGCLSVELVHRGEARNCFVLARPGGHHALRNKAMGFCLINNVAVAARHAQDKLGLKRILVVDWDVHHCNGTQSSFYYDPNVCVISLHQEWPFWPGDSGLSTEYGYGDGKGYNINLPLPAGTGDRGYIKAWDMIVDPIAREFAPELILLSAGYDAHVDDPISGQRISSAGYHLLSQRLAEVAATCNAPVVAFLEGGYNSQVLADCVMTTMRVLNSQNQQDCMPREQTGDNFSDQVDERILRLSRQFRQYWTL